MKTTKIGCLFATAPIYFFFFFLRSCRLKAILIGLLLLVNWSSLCLAQEHSARKTTFSLAAGSASGKLSLGEDHPGTPTNRGFMFDIASGDEPLRFAVDWFSSSRVIMFSESPEYLATQRIIEIDLGVRYYFDDLSPVVDFYAGGGLALASAHYEYKFITALGPAKGDFSGSGSGIYLGFGTRHVFDNGFSLGFDYRDSNIRFEFKSNLETGLVPLLSPKDNLDFTRTSLTLGYSW